MATDTTLMHGIASALGMDPLTIKNDIALSEVDEELLDDEEVDEENRVDPRLEADFELARKNIKEVSKKGVDAVATLQIIAAASEDMKAYEALKEMIKAVAAAQQSLLDIHQRRKKVKDVPLPKSKAVAATEPANTAAAPTTINQVFVGSSNDLDAFLGASR